MLINKKSETNLSGFYVVFNGSVLNEDSTNYGISHLCEHLKCRMFNQLYNTFDRYNITWNAITTDDYIMFFIHGLDEYINKYKEEFLDCLIKSFNISKKDFETEKKVVIEEYKDYFQVQETNLFTNTYRKIFHTYNAIGKLDVLENITYEQVKKYWDKYLLEPSKVINISKDNIFNTNIKFNENIKKEFIVDKKDKLEFEEPIDYDKVAVIGYIELFKNFPYNKISFVLDMLGLNSLSPFWNELREKQGLTYGINTVVNNISSNQGLATSTLVTTSENVNKVLKTYKKILTNIDDYLTTERFEIVKDYYTTTNKMNKIESYLDVDDYLINDDWNINKILDIITFDECLNIFKKYLTYDKWSFETDMKINECLTYNKWLTINEQ